MAQTAQTTQVEATKKVIQIRLSGLHQPKELNNQPNTNGIIFLNATDAVSGNPLPKVLHTTASKAAKFGFSCFTFTENAKDDGNGGKIEELNTLTNKPRYFEIVVRDVPKAQAGESVGYYTKEGKFETYKKDDCYIIESVTNELDGERFNVQTYARIKIQAFENMTGQKFDIFNAEHRAILEMF